ncbi:non-structural maintenance of chromosomes element 4 homolog A-like isoform X2 [Prunus dulcis]|uniref:non-structural maintenance of chromosomes element 4 homolog A-like isoform X2 n=1 Tax=Prunus dulcis TaxID=3755 RepID=UPI001481DB68|nr:non-structural maintenance of chromosomes element 4 homolog A-like isoform X2 [Prunus dulcis]
MMERELAGSSSRGRDKMEQPQAVADRRALRSRYFTVKTLIHVQNPREQVADAEALLDIANTLMTSVKAQNKEGITATDFVSCILRDFGQQSGLISNREGVSCSISWKDIGTEVSNVFQRSPQCCTMIGPMNAEVKQRKAHVHTKRVKPTENDTPEELDNVAVEEEPETVKNVTAMFNILRKNRRARLENLVLNGNSFAQTVENLFALSFLVKDGRAEIKINEEGHHLVCKIPCNCSLSYLTEDLFSFILYLVLLYSFVFGVSAPRNAPAAKAIASGEVAYCHFVFRFDFKDWKLMKESVGDGEQLMPHRRQENISSNSQFDPQCVESEATTAKTPIRKLSRHRGLVLQQRPVGGCGTADSNQSVVEDSPVCDYSEDRTAAIRKGKRKLM